MEIINLYLIIFKKERKIFGDYKIILQKLILKFLTYLAISKIYIQLINF